MSDFGDAVAEELRESHAAVKLAFSWLGVNKSLTKEQKQQAASCFGAEGEAIAASKKLIDTKHEAYRAVTRVKREIGDYFKRNTLPFPEDGVRLVDRDRLVELEQRLVALRAELDQKVAALQERYTEIRMERRESLGDLYDGSEYPERLDGEFGVTWDLVNVMPPDYLKNLSPRLYEQQMQRMQSKFDEAVALAETAFLEEFSKLVNHLVERLGGNEDGTPKQFRESTLTNLQDFFDHFKDVSVRSNADLDALVEQAQNVVKGLQFETLQHNGTTQDLVRDAMAKIGSQLDTMMVSRPLRSIKFED